MRIQRFQLSSCKQCAASVAHCFFTLCARRQAVGANMIDVRSERPSDCLAIEAVVVSAFRTAEHSSGTEQFIVRALRESGQLTLSLVAEEGGHVVVGHVAVSPVTINGALAGWHGLGPVAVAPQRQGLGIGRLLVSRSLENLRASGAAGCVVLGNPRYYARFGFAPEPALVLPGAPAEYFQAIAFNGAVPAGGVAYPAAFRATA